MTTIQVIQAYTDSYKDLSLVSSPPVEIYCKKHGLRYDLINLEDLYIDNRPPAWGKILCKNTDLVKKILRKVWSMTEFINHGWWENAAIHELYRIDYENINSITEFVPHNIFNAYELSQYGLENKEAEICNETFIAHFPALSIEKRIELINKYIK